jgi:DNA (cytosine-5)-methyltransferase 1
MIKNNYTVGSLFAGVGGICQGFKNAGYSVSWANELDKNACETYKLNHNKTDLIVGDINDINISKLEKIDIVTAGFPCQPFSQAGHRKGFDDDRGQVFYRVIDFLGYLKPKAFLLENVKNLVTHANGESFNRVKQAIIGAGYSFIPFVLRSNDHSDIPQARERLYIVGFIDEPNFNYDHPVKANYLDLGSNYKSKKFLIPKKTAKRIRCIRDFLDENFIHPSDYYEKTDNHIHVKVASAINTGCKNSVYQYRRHYVRQNKSNVCPTLTANMGGGGHNVPIIHDGARIRRLNPKECFNLQGFPSNFIFPNISRGQLYKQAGNSVVVPVIELIAKEITRVLDEDTKHTA